MKFRVRHLTTYRYGEAVQLSHHAAHLRPRPVPGQTVGAVTMAIRPEPAVLHDGRRDYFGNPTTFFTIQEPHRTLEVEASFSVETAPRKPPPQVAIAWDAVRPAAEAMDFLFDSPQVPCLAEASDYAAPSFPPGRPLVEAALDLSARIHADFAFDADATTVGTPLATVFEERRGVCQDFAHAGIACLRAMGLAARYVSGYIRTTPPLGQERLVGADASHAWLSVHLPGWGWLDLDPTNDAIAGPEHVVVAWGRDYDDVSPLRGVVLGGGDHKVEVAVDVVEEEG
ncbi:MAG: transglutaminase family protein [Alphaproteobacteria bacterium]|nr:transglutaminase family protein [Alphaproteobacteria bacterium]